jgi:hypothetical protein
MIVELFCTPDIPQRGRFSPFMFKGSGVQHGRIFGLTASVVGFITDTVM